MIWVEVRYREVHAPGVLGPWLLAPRALDGVRSIEVPDAVRGSSYEVEASRVDDETGRRSEWAPLGVLEVLEPLDRPAAVRGIRVECGEQLVWEPSADGLAVAYEIRHAVGDWRHWEDMQAIPGVTVPGPPFPMCGIPKGQRTIAVRPLSPEGVAGEPAYAVFHLGPYDDGELVDLRRVTFAPGWLADPDTVPGVTLTIDKGALLADQIRAELYPPVPGSDGRADTEDEDAPAWQDDDLTVAWPALYDQVIVRVAYDPGAAASAHYDFGTDEVILSIDPVVAQGENWYAEYRLHDAPDDSGNDTAPAWKPNDSSVAWHGVDDSSPAWGHDSDPAWSEDEFGPADEQYPWKPWPGRLRISQAQRIDIRIVIPAGPVQGRLAELVIRESRPLKAGEELASLGPLGQVLQTPAAASASPAAGALPQARADGTLDPGFLPSEAEGWRPVISLDYTQFTAALNNKTITVYTFLPGEFLVSYLLVQDEAWGGGLLSSVLGDMGSPGDAQHYLAEADLETAPSSTAYFQGTGGGPQDLRSDSPLLFKVTGDDILSNLTQGRARLFIRTTKPFQEAAP